MSLFDTGVRPAIDAYLTKKSEEERDYGDYWSASSAGYCMRLNILRRLKVPRVPEVTDRGLDTQLTFEAGHFIHWWLQKITKEEGLSIAQELELQDEHLMVRGHIDDLILMPGDMQQAEKEIEGQKVYDEWGEVPHLILYDYKTAHNSSFNYKKKSQMGYYHKMQLGTYMYMLRRGGYGIPPNEHTTGYNEGHVVGKPNFFAYPQLTEGRIFTINKSSLVDYEPKLDTHEHQLIWSDEFAGQIVDYWHALNGYWEMKILPPCTCLDHDGGFMGRRSSKGKVYNPYFYQDEPCSAEWAMQFEQAKEFIK